MMIGLSKPKLLRSKITVAFAPNPRNGYSSRVHFSTPKRGLP
jgi:hypothetical protein